jgi:cell division protein FtsI/penicillin-binding protein 2
MLTPRQILVESSNVGAVQVGLRLGREGFAEYLDTYRFGQRTALGIPGESTGSLAFEDLEGMMGMAQRTFWVYTAPSLSFGYETNVTPVQLLRAYLTLLSGRPRELRMYRRTAVGGRITDVPPPQTGERFLSEDHLELLRDALRGVVSDEPNATGRWLFEQLEEAGQPMVAGKTGTSQRQAADGWIRTASFAGFAPVEKPRYLAVCVLQKPGAAAFWGGRYAAPAAGRLLLRALSQSLLQRPADSRVSANPPERRTARLDER